jgi:hypothetical protein
MELHTDNFIINFLAVKMQRRTNIFPYKTIYGRPATRAVTERNEGRKGQHCRKEYYMRVT